MPVSAVPLGFRRICLGLAVCWICLSPASAQEFITGAAAQAWENWQPAMQAVLNRDRAAAETAFGELLKLDPSAFRIALLAEHMVMRTNMGGAVLLFEQDIENKAVGENGAQVGALLLTGREQMNEADDGWYWAALGRFDLSQANFRALLDSNPDPVALLEFADRVPRRTEMLIQLSDNPVVGDSAREVLRLLAEGERRVKADPIRIREYIDRLGGPPRAFENSVDRLKDSGEWAVPFIVQALRDPAKQALLQPLLRALPMIDRPALNPLVIALRMKDQTVRRYLLLAAGRIGYTQALPYLLQVRDGEHTPAEVRDAAAEAIGMLEQKSGNVPSGLTAAEAFYNLAQQYYEDDATLAADPRLDTANVWYWREDLLQNVVVPTAIFNEIMCMRCCEEALLLSPDHKGALALWLAANFRREAQLPEGEKDATRPANYPSAAYFAEAAGAEYCQMALARAVRDVDRVVALGAIEALRRTAGRASVGATSPATQSLGDALLFPDRMVRIRAGLALAHATPTQPYQNYQNLPAVLSEALLLHGGGRYALVVDPDEDAANMAAAALRSDGYEVAVDAALFAGLEKSRHDLPGCDLILIASNIVGPALPEGLKALRDDSRYALTPVVVVARPADRIAVRDLIRRDPRVTMIERVDSPDIIKNAAARVSKSAGSAPVTPEIGTKLALEAAHAVILLAQTDNQVFKVAECEPALISALGSNDRELKLAAARGLGYIGTQGAQEAIAKLALDDAQPEDLRIAMFAALAEAAKRRGNLLGDEAVTRLVGIAENDANLAIREAAAQALGAFSLPGNPASTIIRNQYAG